MVGLQSLQNIAAGPKQSVIERNTLASITKPAPNPPSNIVGIIKIHPITRESNPSADIPEASNCELIASIDV